MYEDFALTIETSVEAAPRRPSAIRNVSIHLLGAVANFSQLYDLWGFSDWKEKQWRHALSQSGTIGSRKLILEDQLLIIESSAEIASLRLSAIRHVSVHAQVVIFWIAGSHAHYVPKSIFGSADEEQAFLSELNARMTSSQKGSGAGMVRP
jgi:hypothetical protein